MDQQVKSAFIMLSKYSVPYMTYLIETVNEIADQSLTSLSQVKRCLPRLSLSLPLRDLNASIWLTSLSRNLSRCFSMECDMLFVCEFALVKLFWD